MSAGIGSSSSIGSPITFQSLPSVDAQPGQDRTPPAAHAGEPVHHHERGRDEQRADQQPDGPGWEDLPAQRDDPTLGLGRT